MPQDVASSEVGSLRGAPSPGTDAVLARNIQALVELRTASDARRTWQARLADAVTRFVGSPAALLAHATLFGGWVALNLGAVPAVAPWDPFPFSMLAGLASIEAIFMTSFVLMSQRRQAQVNDRHAELDLQMNLLAEHEVTRLIDMVDAITVRLGIERPADVDSLKEEVRPEAVVERIEGAIRPP
jgi:uncharacterized membrane protein